MEQKNPYREKLSRHPSFRPERESVWSSLPVRLALVVGVLFCALLGYEHLRRNGGETEAVRLANTMIPTDTPSSTTPAVNQADKPIGNSNQQFKNNHTNSETPTYPGRAQQSAETLTQPQVEKALTTFQYIMDRDSQGNIIGLGKINGIGVRFLADTGATTVVVPERLANQIGLKKGASIPFKTGGGVVVHYATTLDSLTLGQIEIRNVAAAINPAMQDDFVLLGMSALGLMDMHMDHGNLVLKYRAYASDAIESQSVIDVPFKHSYRECAKGGNKFDKATLDCMRGK